MENRRFFKKTLAGIASLAMLAGMVPADVMAGGQSWKLDFTWTTNQENVSVDVKDQGISFLTIEDTDPDNIETWDKECIEYTLKNGYYVIKTYGEDYSVSADIVDEKVENAIKKEFPKYDGNELIYGDVYDLYLATVLYDLYSEAFVDSGSKYYNVNPKTSTKSFRRSAVYFRNIKDTTIWGGESYYQQILSECLPDNKIRYTAVVWKKDESQDQPSYTPYTSSVTVKRTADTKLNEVHKPKLSEKKTGEAPDCAYEYYECEYCGAEVDENGEKINKYDGSTWHDIDAANADVSWDYTDTSNPKATIKYTCKNEKIQREFTISYKQYTGEEALGEGMSLITGKVDTFIPDSYYPDEKKLFLTDGDEKYIVGPYNILAKMENVSSEASCYKDIKAAYDATFYMYLGQDEEDIDNDDEDEILDCYTNSKKGSITFDVAKTGHKILEGTRVEAKEPTDLKNGNFEFYLCDNDKDEGTIVIVDGQISTCTCDDEGYYMFVDPEINIFDYDNSSIYRKVTFDKDSKTFKYNKNNKEYTYNFKTQKFECTGQTSISAIPGEAVDYPLWYGYKNNDSLLSIPKEYVAESYECEIYPHYAYYYYNGQYIIEKAKDDDKWVYIDTNTGKTEVDFTNFGESLNDSKAREFIPEDEAVFDEFGNLEQAHIYTDGKCEVKQHKWSEFETVNKYVVEDESEIELWQTGWLEQRGFMLDKKSLKESDYIVPTYPYSTIYNYSVITDDGKKIKFESLYYYDNIEKWASLGATSIDGTSYWNETVSIKFEDGKATIFEGAEVIGTVSDMVPCVCLDDDDKSVVPCKIQKEHVRECENFGCTAVDAHYETGTYIPTSAGHYVFGSACEFEYTDSDGKTIKCGSENTYKDISVLFENILNGKATMYDHNWVDANAEYLVCEECGYTKKNDTPSVKTTSNSISLAELDGKDGYRQTYTFDINSNGKEIAYYGVVYNKDTKNIRGLKAEDLIVDNKGEFTVPIGYKAEKRTAIKNKGTLTVNLTSDSKDKYVTVMGYVVYKVGNKYEISTTDVNVNTFAMIAEDEFNNACSVRTESATSVLNDKGNLIKGTFKYDIETSEGYTLKGYGCLADKRYMNDSKLKEAKYDDYDSSVVRSYKTGSEMKIRSNGEFTVNVSATDLQQRVAAKSFIIVEDKYKIEYVVYTDIQTAYPTM